MNKKLLIFVFVAAFSASVFGQNRMSSKEYYESHPDGLKQFHEVRRAAANAVPMGGGLPTLPSEGPGDHFIGFLYLGDTQFGIGDVIRPRFIAAKSTDAYASNGVIIYGQIFVPGPSGQYDAGGTIIYVQADNGNYGYYRGGLAGNEVLPLYSLPITSGMPFGEYLMSWSIVDSQSGTLIQQEYARASVNHTGPTGKGPYTLDSVSTFATATGSYVTLQGRFPASTTVQVFAGIPQYNWLQGPMQTDTSGHFVSFGVGAPIVLPGYQGQSMMQDVIVHFPLMRESVLLHNAYSVQAPVLQAIPLN